MGRERIGAWMCVVLGGFAASARGGDLHAKQVAAPASDITSGIVKLPEPASLAIRSRAFARPIAFERDDSGTWVCELPLDVDAAGPLAFAWSAPDTTGWRVSVRDASGASRSIDDVTQFGAGTRDGQVLGDTLPGWIVDRRDFAIAPRGNWTLRFESSSDAKPSSGLFVARSSGALELSAHVSTLATLADADFAVLARASDEHGTAIDGSGFVEFESGSVSARAELVDDGAHEDGASGDGLFGALVPRGLSGEVLARVEFERAGARRSAFLSFPVLERRTLLDGSVTATVHDAVRLRLELGAFPLGPAARLQVSAEVWGTDASGEAVPVCWLSRMVGPQGVGSWRLPLYLDARWLELVHALPPFELRAVRVQDPDTHVVFDERDVLELPLAALPRIVGTGTTMVAPAMLTGPMIVSATSLGSGTTATHHPLPRALMLVHGYCSGGAIWPAADFTQPRIAFVDPNANRTHDQFAQMLAQTGSAYGSFGVVGHSQGGPAALHLLTYYQSGLDFAFGPRRIQSVASPYQGTPLASLGSFACGVNNDMTPAGSATWLAGIPSWARAEVFYWTTQNSAGVCNFLTSLFLADPEDGTVEQFRGQLVGGNSMGHVVGWCHTTGMTNPANYTDHTRNAQMNLKAAR
ncbi:MAG: hypothetical protein K8S98_18980 [Planctomycetes bacterium]|nr:hypothetical protein [Planctomycetota bacterium]